MWEQRAQKKELIESRRYFNFEFPNFKVKVDRNRKTYKDIQLNFIPFFQV